jgi:hypothetical protein
MPSQTLPPHAPVLASIHQLERNRSQVSQCLYRSPRSVGLWEDPEQRGTASAQHDRFRSTPRELPADGGKLRVTLLDGRLEIIFRKSCPFR